MDVAALFPTHAVAGFQRTGRRHNPVATGGIAMYRVAGLRVFSSFAGLEAANGQ